MSIEPGQYFGTQNFIGSISLPILRRPPVARGEEEHVVGAHHLRKIVIEITGLIGILKHKKHRSLHFIGQ